MPITRKGKKRSIGEAIADSVHPKLDPTTVEGSSHTDSLDEGSPQQPDSSGEKGRQQAEPCPSQEDQQENPAVEKEDHDDLEEAATAIKRAKTEPARKEKAPFPEHDHQSKEVTASEQ